MKKFKSLVLAAATTMMLGSCSDEVVNPGGDTNKYPAGKDGAYFALTIDLPSAGGNGRSRSTTTEPGDNGSTSSNGVEVGQDYENKINEVIIVLAHNPANPTTAVPTNGFIAATTVPSGEIKSVDTNSDSYQVTSTFTMTQLDNFYNALGENWTDFSCNIFIFANPGAAIKNIIFGDVANNNAGAPTILSNDWINKVVTLTQDADVPVNTIANREKGFLMMNALIATREIPSNINDWRHYTTSSNPFDLSGDNTEVSIDNGANNRGSIKLERAAARFDFRDGSPLGNFTYHVVRDGDASVDGGLGNALIDIQLTNMSLVNVNKSFYALPRVSKDGLNYTPETANATNGWQLCGSEKPWTINAGGGYSNGNYVVDADQVWKTQTANSFDGDNAPANVAYADHFFYPLFTADGKVNNIGTADKWYTSKCADVIQGTNDNPVSWNQSGTFGQYHIWTYATENTIAGTENQKNGISTGVVFKGKMVATEFAQNSTDPHVKELAEAISNPNANTRLYSFGGNLYVNWKGIRDAALNAAISGIKWEPFNDEDPTKGEFKFTAIDRTNILYVAVFGNGGFGTVEFTYSEYDINTGEYKGTHTGTLTDTEQVSPTCADAKWTAYEKALTSGTTTDKNVALAAFKKTATDEKITIYEASSENGDPLGFYCYYYYWNRHNNLNQEGIMNPMEFAVVRNNVYKLAVTNIKQLGHPRLSENDPDRPTGGTDDESQKIYLTVTAEVLPWVVRVNDIEF